MAISNFLNEQRLQKFLGPQFINEGIPSVYRPADVSPFFRMDATSGVTPELFQNFNQQYGYPPRKMNYNTIISGDGEYLLQPDINTNPPMLAPLDMNRFQGVSDMSMIDETTNDEQDQEYIDQVNQSNNKFSGIMDLIGSIAIPGYGFFKNIARGGLEGLRGFNQRLQQSDFAQSPTLADYFDARSYGGRDARDRASQKTMREARAIQTQVDRRGDSTSRVSDRNRSSVTTSSAAKSKGVGGGGYTKSDSARESYRGRF